MANILLIDDDELLRDIVLPMLQLDGHQVSEAVDGQAGRQLFKANPRFERVITDILMPGLDGARVIAQMRQLRQLRPELPIVAISGGRHLLTPQFNLETANLAGASCQLVKPFNRQGLQAAIRLALASEDVR